MALRPTIIYIHPAAPAKPLAGAPCNGCGVCCLVEPCPLGVLLSRRRQGACQAVHWDVAHSRYQCGAVVVPRVVLQQALPRRLRGLSRLLTPILPRLARRWIASGVGCDSHLQALPPDSPTMPTSCPTDAHP